MEQYYNSCNQNDSNDYSCKPQCKTHDYTKPYYCYQPAAQFVSAIPQIVDTRDVTLVNFPATAIPDKYCIRLISENTVQLDPGRYHVNYYVTITNELDDGEHDTFTTKLILNGLPLDYTTAKVRIDDPDSEFIGFLTKTNLVDVTCCSTLQLGIKSSDPIEEGCESRYELDDVSIVIEKVY